MLSDFDGRDTQIAAIQMPCDGYHGQDCGEKHALLLR